MEKYSEPQICVFNNKEIAEKLQTEYTVATGNLGTIKKIKYKDYEEHRYLNIKYDMVDNLHEYRVLIIDFQNKCEEELCEEDEEPEGIPYLFKVDCPKKVFNPVPFVAVDILREHMREDCFRIIFANSSFEEKYGIVEKVGQRQYSYPDEFNRNIYETIGAIVSSKNGEKVKTENNELAEIIAKYISKYKVIFDLPTIWDSQQQISIIDTNYVPLLKNQDEEVISYIGYKKDTGYELLLPVCEKKDELIQTLFSQVLPEILPEYFPESKKFRWINNSEFKPEEVIRYEKEKEQVTEEYRNKILKLENKTKAVYEKYRFLNEMLIQTGQPLVEAVCHYLKWLGFENVVLVDGNEEILREDIQIWDNDDLYIIEVKGIGRTSTDSECSQIVKHRRKREKENRDKNVWPIYIVNHQRYMNPLLRDNPPFKDNQIEYAEDDERGLLTTWQLFKQFKFIEAGIFTKEETRNSLKKIGLITLLPSNLKRIGKLDEYFKKAKAGIIKLNSNKISIGDSVWARKGDNWIKTIIISLRLNDIDVESACDCEIGIATEVELAKGYELFVKIEE